MNTKTSTHPSTKSSSKEDDRFTPVTDTKEYDKALEASKAMQEEAREDLSFTKEGAEKAAEKKEQYDAVAEVVGFTTHPDSPTKLSTKEVLPSLNDAEARAQAYDVPTGTV